jgi:endoglucanase
MRHHADGLPGQPLKSMRLLQYFWIVVVVNSYPSQAQTNQIIKDRFGAIVRGDTTRKQVALVFTGDEFADGGNIIRVTLDNHKIKGSFFLTGNFYSNPDFKPLIIDLKKEGHYLGAHSDKHLLYAAWTKRDSLLVDQNTFNADLLQNYERMIAFGISKTDAPYFVPPYEWYNGRVVKWARELNLQLVNFSPGTRSTADYTYPEMGKSYLSSDEIEKSIMTYESKNGNGLNGFILLIHVGTDPKRTDKFYNKLDNVLNELKKKGYQFVRIDQLLSTE